MAASWFIGKLSTISQRLDTLNPGEDKKYRSRKFPEASCYMRFGRHVTQVSIRALAANKAPVEVR
jgi:hypothetical protein